MSTAEQHDSEAGHDHSQSVDEGNEKRVLVALVITFVFLVIEVVGGIVSGSLVLLADAGHMLIDVLALLLSWIGFRVARRPADAKRTFGYHRFPVLAAFVNGISLLFISAGIVYEAIERLFGPGEEVLSGVLLSVAIAGLLANLVALWILSGGKEENVNLKSAALHVLSDLLGSVAAIAAAIIIMLTQWTPIDPILSIVVSLLIVRSAWAIVSQTGHTLMQGTPVGFDAEQLRTELVESVPEIEEVHHVHVWELTKGKPVISLHAKLKQDVPFDGILERVKGVLRDRFDLNHSVVQVESADGACPD